MAYIKTLLCLTVLVHCALSESRVSVRNAPQKVRLLARPSPVVDAVEHTSEDGLSVQIVQSNLPTHYQQLLVKELAYVWQRYQNPLSRAEAFWTYLSKVFAQYKNQVVIDFQGAAIVQSWFAELSVNGNQYVLVWGV